LKSLLLVAMLRWSVPVLPVVETTGFVLRLAMAGAVSAGAAVGAAHLNFGEGRVRQIALSGVIAFTGFAMFLGASLLLQMDEPKEFWHWTMEKLNRRKTK
jgi:hypothetical protein